ncbi:hypothetical protein HFP67_24360 [Bacillus sp. CB102A.1]
MIAGLEEPDKEKYILETSACILLAKKIKTPPHERNIGMVFQDFALWRT